MLFVSAVLQHLKCEIWWEEDNNWQILSDLCIDVFSLQWCLKTQVLIFHRNNQITTLVLLQFETSLLKLSFCSTPYQMHQDPASVEVWDTSHTSAVLQSVTLSENVNTDATECQIL